MLTLGRTVEPQHQPALDILSARSGALAAAAERVVICLRLQRRCAKTTAISRASTTELSSFIATCARTSAHGQGAAWLWLRSDAAPA